LTLKETIRPIASGAYGLTAMETHNVGSGTVVGHDIMARGTFTDAMNPTGSWLEECSAGIIACAEGVATFICNGVGDRTEAGGVSLKSGALFKTTFDALSELNGKYYIFTYEADIESNAEWNLYPCT
jgi:hypothetical protein